MSEFMAKFGRKFWQLTPKPDFVTILSFKTGINSFITLKRMTLRRRWRVVAADDACNRWNKITGPMIDGGLDFASDDPVPLMKQVFYLK